MKKIFIGISGGVDSSTSAYILKKQGYDVTGVFIKAWYPDFINCNWRKEMQDAMRVCANLKIPFLMCNAENEYKKNVIDYMIDEYKIGRTPNPDVMCNKEIKFKVFLKFALENDADFIATGHYAQNEKDGERYKLICSNDLLKDQTYFLWNLNQKILSKTLFPIGHLSKNEVRKIAKKANLLTFNKKDSQGLCFLGHVDMKDFLSKYIKTQQGELLDENGRKVGTHEGAIFYTIGERHRLNFFNDKNNAKKLHVISKDVKKNTVTVGQKEDINVGNIIKISNYNFIRDKLPIGTEINAIFRYHGDVCRTKIISLDQNCLQLKLISNPFFMATGQSVVFYIKNECVGGGIVEL